MKRLLLLLMMLSSTILFAQYEHEWEEWQPTSCYSKVFFRLKSEKKHGEQYHWKIQFKSNYPEIISFNYHVTDKLQQHTITTHRKTLNAMQTSEEIDIYAKDEDIFLLVDKLSLSPYPEGFEDCN